MAKRQKSVCFIQLMLEQLWLKAKQQLWNASQQWGCFVSLHTQPPAFTEKHLYTYTGAGSCPEPHRADLPSRVRGEGFCVLSVGPRWEKLLLAASTDNLPLWLLPGKSFKKADRDARQSHGWPGNTASTNGRVCKIIAQERKLALKIPTENGFLLHIRKTKNFQ